MDNQFLFLVNNDKNGYSFIITVKEYKVFFANEHGEYECLEPNGLLEYILDQINAEKITILGTI